MIPGDAFRVQIIRLAQRMGWDPEKSTADFYEISERGPAALEFVETRVAELEGKIEKFETKARIERDIEDDIVTAIGDTDVDMRPDQIGNGES